MNPKRAKTYANKLSKVALKSDMRFKLAAVVVGDDFDGFYGYNKSLLSHKGNNKGLRSRHAEVDAIDGHEYDGKASLIVIRVKKSGGFGNAKPCEFCQMYARQHGIRTIVYTNSAGEFEQMDLWKWD